MSQASRLHTRVATAFYGNFTKLREAQETAIAPLLNGENIVLSSGTGSGKTEAVVAPLIDRYWREARLQDCLTLLYIAPTKALANDLEKRLHKPLSDLGMRVGVRHGDRDDLVFASTPHLLITTPESLEVLLLRKDTALGSIRAVVIDEVHLLYNTQRGLQLSILLRRLQEVLVPPFQWAAISATVGRLEDIRDFLFGPSVDAVFLRSSPMRSIDAKICYVQSDARLLELVDKMVGNRNAKLLLFANSRRECERLVNLLQKLPRLKDCVFAHYSSLSAEVRLETERDFSSVALAVCVATSTLELGIDIGDIDAVLLWGVPGSVESFLQRIGRSNRRSKKTNVVCLVPPESKDATFDGMQFLALVEAGRKGLMPLRAPYSLYGAAAQQCLSIIHSDAEYSVRTVDLCKLFGHLSHLNRPTVERILAELVGSEHIHRHGFKNRYAPAEKLHRLVDLRMIYGNYGAGSQQVVVRYGTKELGTVPATNLLRLGHGDTVRINGKCWRIRKVSPDGFDLEPVQTNSVAQDFSYGGIGIQYDSFVTNLIWQQLCDNAFSLELLDSVMLPLIEQKLNNVRSCGRLHIPTQRHAQIYQYDTYAGYLVNKAIGLITKQPSFTATNVTLSTAYPVPWHQIPTDPHSYEIVFPQLFEADSRQSIFQTVLPPDLQREEFLQIWLKDSTVKEALTRLSQSSSFNSM